MSVLGEVEWVVTGRPVDLSDRFCNCLGTWGVLERNLNRVRQDGVRILERTAKREAGARRGILGADIWSAAARHQSRPDAARHGARGSPPPPPPTRSRPRDDLLGQLGQHCTRRYH